MGEYDQCPHCEEDCIKLDELTKREGEGVFTYDFKCPHCGTEIHASAEPILFWSLSIKKVTS